MGESKEVKLYGFWASSDCAIVRHVLRLKGVPFEYVEDDPRNEKLPILIDDRSVTTDGYKKLPVLVVGGVSVDDPLAIVEFVERVWKDPPLLPEDPQLRAKTLFWADFYQNLMPASIAIVRSEGEALQTANAKFIAHMTALEDGISADFPGRGAFINGDRPGLLDVIMGSCSNGMRALEEVAGMALLLKDRMLILSSSMTNFGGLEIATAIPYDKLVQLHWDMRKNAQEKA